MQSDAGADAADILLCENFALCHVLRDEDGTGACPFFFLLGGKAVFGRAECLFQNTDLRNHFLKFLGLHGKCAIRTAVAAF